MNVSVVTGTWDPRPGQHSENSFQKRKQREEILNGADVFLILNFTLYS